jgi:pSer/pThr/pTyr-binding forkhead associated (FHA) protein
VAYLTQFSSSVPVIKFLIDQSVMTIGQDFEMDICIPDDGIANNHATLEASKQAGSYLFSIKSQKNESLLQLNGVETAQVDLKDGDWLIIGDVEFQFTDDGANDIKEMAKSSVVPITTAKKAKPKQAAVKDEEEVKTVSTKEFIANSRNSRRRLNI